MTDRVNPLVDISLLSDARSRSISAENFSGAKNMGARATDGTGRRCADEAGLGVGWKISPSISIEPGQTYVLAEIEGPGRIQTMWFTGSLGRSYILRIYWDGQESPSVETPLADFFGCGWHGGLSKVQPRYAPLNSAMIVVNPVHGLNSYWPMPFRKRCKITLENRDEKKTTLYYQINYELGEVAENAAYFHAMWRRENPVATDAEYAILDNVRGKGHFAGVMLHVGINGQNLWWGEGEVKFFIDGDEHPTICGTGTEDYFGGAYGWEVEGRYTAYTTPYLGVHQIHEPTGGEDVQQRFAMYRWHVPDPVRFEQDLRVTIQDLGWRRNGRTYLSRNDDFSSVAYWYQTLPHVPFAPLPGPFEMENL
ncbi:MAG: glycoside hydrolase family 172 protein [Anaerolineae bacterium]